MLLFILASSLLRVEAQDLAIASPSVFDLAHQNITSSLHLLANRLDSAFGDKRADDEFGRSRMRVSYAYTLREEQSGIDDFQFRFNLSLPNLQKFTRFNTKKKIANKTSDATNSSTETAIPEQPIKDPWINRFDAGIRVGYPPQVFTRHRLRKNWSFETFIPRFVHEIAWFSDEGFLQTAGINFDRSLKDNILLRFVNESNWQITRKDFRTSHGPSVLQSIGNNNALSYNLSAQSLVENGTWYFNNYNLNLTYRHNIKNNWLFGDFTPGIDFPKTQSFRRSPYILLRIEALFG